MKKLAKLFLLALILVSACTSNKAKNKTSQLIGLNKSPYPLDSADTYSFIGYVNKFSVQNTDEFYIELYFKEADLSEQKFSKIEESADSIVFKDDECERKRIPMKVAIPLFDFRGMETLSLFDRQNHFLTKAYFVRVEHLSEASESSFIAVYKANQTNKLDKAMYCVGNLKDKFGDIETTPFNDKELTEQLEKKLGYKHQEELNGHHYKMGDRCYSVINIDTTAFITESKNDEVKCLYKSGCNENITLMAIVPIIRNSRPVMITKFGKCQTDEGWSNLLIFDGKSYQPADRQKIKALKRIKN